MTVPEAAADLNSEPPLTHYDVGFPRERSIMQPIAHAERVKRAADG